MSTPVPPRGPKKGKPGSGKGGKTPPRGRQAAYQRQRQQKQLALGAVAAVVVVILVLVVIAVTRPAAKSKNQAAAAAPASLVSAITSVSPAALALQAKHDVVSYPTVIHDPLLTEGGKPKIVYVGAEYCPYCGGERWPLVMALSKFGTFHNLSLITSMATDQVYSIPSFTFVGSTYSSPYFSFDPTETETVAQTKLQTLSRADAALFAKYDSAGSIPFADLAGKWVIVGASFTDTAMETVSHAAVAKAVSTTSTKYAADIQATAGMLTSRLCQLTGGKPGNVCKYFPSVIGK